MPKGEVCADFAYMPRRMGCAVIGILAVVLNACTELQPKLVVTEDGPANVAPVGAQTSFAIFQKDYSDLYMLTLTGQAPNDMRPGLTNRGLVAEGGELAHQLCASFFKTAGQEQQRLLFARDAIGVVGTLATGVIGAAHGSAAATATVGLGSSASLSGISIYARNFLFSEDNVQGVQALTLKALSAVAARATDPTIAGNDYDFLGAIQTIMDIQEVCEVQNILSLVRESLNATTPSVSTIGGHLEATVIAAQSGTGGGTPSPQGETSTPAAGAILPGASVGSQTKNAGPQRPNQGGAVVAAPTTSAAFSAAGAERFLQRQANIDFIAKTANDLAAASPGRYTDDKAPLTELSVLGWVNGTHADPSHLIDTAKQMGWNGQ